MIDDENSIYEISRKLKPTRLGHEKHVDLFDSIENNFETDVGLLNQG